jgi:hypothetical protein
MFSSIMDDSSDNCHVSIHQRIRSCALSIVILWLFLAAVLQQYNPRIGESIRFSSPKYKTLIKPKLTLKYSRFSFQRTDQLPISRIVCLSESFNESYTHSGALLRSCKYKDLCYSLMERRLVLFPTRTHFKLLSAVHSEIFLSSMSKPILASTVSSMIASDSFIRPHYQKHKHNNIYYRIHQEFQSTVWIPILMSCDIQSVLWEIYLPIFSLLELFDLSSMHFGILLLNDCNQTIQKIRQFTDMMQIQMPEIISLSSEKEILNQSFLCLHQAVSGMGGLGLQQNKPPQNLSYEQFVPPRHTHRGNNIRNFQSYILGLMFNHSSSSYFLEQPEQFVSSHSQHISKNIFSAVSANLTIKVLKKSMTLREKAAIVIMSKILVLSSIEDKTVAIFLPKGSHLVLIGPPIDDWDFWTNHVSIHVHLLQAYVSGAIKYLVDEVFYFSDSKKHPDNLLLEQHTSIPFLNNHSIVFRNVPPKATKIHCVAEKLYPQNEGAPNFRSCHFENLCFDMKAKRFVIIPSPALSMLLTRLQRLLRHGNYFSTLPSSMVLTPQPKSILGLQYRRHQIYNETETISSYYQLHANWISTHTLGVCNPGKFVVCYYFLIHLSRHV